MSQAEVKKQLVYEGLLSLIEESKSMPEMYCKWVKTRAVADYCDMSIYSARVYLIALEREGRIIKSSEQLNNSLGWHINTLV